MVKAMKNENSPNNKKHLEIGSPNKESSGEVARISEEFL